MTEDEALDIGADFQKYLDDASNESLINGYSLIQLKQAKKLLHKKHIGKAWYDELLKRIEQLEKLQDEKRLNKWWNKPLFICLVTFFLTSVLEFNLFNASSKMQTDLVKKQINEMQKMKNEDKQIATDSLIEELEQNKAWVYQFIQYCEIGDHLGKNGPYSWNWNPPKLNANEKYHVIACGEDKELSIKIINLYSRLESCESIVNVIRGLLNNSSMVSDTETRAKVIKNNKDIEKICLEIQNSFDEPIKKLQSTIKGSNSNKTLVDLEPIWSGTGVGQIKIIDKNGKELEK